MKYTFNKALLRECLEKATTNVEKIAESYSIDDVCLSTLTHAMLYYHREMMSRILEEHKDPKLVIDELWKYCDKKGQVITFDK